MNLETIIGLEIHVQLNTKTKLFCGCDNSAFGATPNTRVCPVCMGFPGMLPVLNERALEKGLLAGAALGCELPLFSKFDRKNYFYPDLPTGYQISQFDKPIAEGGKLEIELEDGLKTIGITRAHLENDAGKLTHTAAGTLCDYNRAGTPLIEIVTDPDLRSPEEAQVLAKEIQKIVRAIGASDADMEKGMMRFDASISLRPMGEDKLYPRTEIKNLNSFTSLLKALKYELAIQRQDWADGNVSETDKTVGWIDDEERTQILREKESANDYRYFPEPDLPPVELTAKRVKEIKELLPELPLAKYFRYQNELGISAQDALKLSEENSLAEFFEATAKASKDPKKSANLILSVVLAQDNWEKSEISSEDIAETLRLLRDNKISSSGAKEILITIIKEGGTVDDIVKQKGLEQVSDNSALEAWVDQVISENPKVIAEIKEGKDKGVQFLMGQVMKLSKGSANPPVVMQILKSKI